MLILSTDSKVHLLSFIRLILFHLTNIVHSDTPVGMSSLHRAINFYGQDSDQSLYQRAPTRRHTEGQGRQCISQGQRQQSQQPAIAHAPVLSPQFGHSQQAYTYRQHTRPINSRTAALSLDMRHPQQALMIEQPDSNHASHPQSATTTITTIIATVSIRSAIQMQQSQRLHAVSSFQQSAMQLSQNFVPNHARIHEPPNSRHVRRRPSIQRSRWISSRLLGLVVGHRCNDDAAPRARLSTQTTITGAQARSHASTKTQQRHSNPRATIFRSTVNNAQSEAIDAFPTITRDAAAAHGKQAFAEFDSRVARDLLVACHHVCPMGFDWYPVNGGYLCDG